MKPTTTSSLWEWGTSRRDRREGTAPIRFFANLAAIMILAAIYFVAGKLGLKLAFLHASATAVWPPAGISLAVFLIVGYRVWPGIFLGAFLVNVTTAGAVLTSFGIATGNTFEGLAGAYLVNRFANGRNAFDQPRDIFKFVGFAGVISTAVSATFGVTSLCLGGLAQWATCGPIWLTWWLGGCRGRSHRGPTAGSLDHECAPWVQPGPSLGGHSRAVLPDSFWPARVWRMVSCRRQKLSTRILMCSHSSMAGVSIRST
jgi:hypothetical protein